ncbi:MAG: hypothetical protein KKE44_16430 [Proteobacteria bacterium]|nr:hypothetical protein [Pseudomonadota bacterium]MBU1584317.1 hypothetical protein [Pseudomonadota bacterium]MBU2451860.1 hypothetical protein [Pseudomonadota bacterium]MBU2628692.1 hypothetical protein [Pseudomonadota bacterium]
MKHKRQIQELMYVAVIIGILCSIAIKSSLVCRTKAHVISITGIFNPIKNDMLLYQAITGDWPRNQTELSRIGFLGGYYKFENNDKTNTDTDSRLYYAINRKWDEEHKLISKGLNPSFLKADQKAKPESSALLGNVNFDLVIGNGAIHFTFDQNDTMIANKTITMQPVNSYGEIFGPIHWICGNKNGESGWRFFGVDHTDIEDRYIPNSLK